MHFVHRTAIKAQALADFVAEFAGDGQSTESGQEHPIWQVYIDKASNKCRSRAEVVLRTPEGVDLERAVAFKFRASNNEAEYEALILGIQLAKICGASKLVAHCDSQLVVGQVLGDFEVKEDRMRSYRSLVVRMMAKFQSFELIKIAGQDNTKADRLEKLAASTDFRSGDHSSVGLLEAPFIQYSESARLVNNSDILASWIQPIYEYIKDGVQPVD